MFLTAAVLQVRELAKLTPNFPQPSMTQPYLDSALHEASRVGVGRAFSTALSMISVSYGLASLPLFLVSDVLSAFLRIEVFAAWACGNHRNIGPFRGFLGSTRSGRVSNGEQQ